MNLPSEPLSSPVAPGEPSHELRTDEPVARAFARPNGRNFGGNETRLWALAATALSAIVIAAIWFVPYIPTNDGPQAVFMGHALNHYGDPNSIFRQQFELGTPITHQAFELLFPPLEVVFGWSAALKLVESVIALGAAWGFAAIVMSVNRRNKWLALAGFALAFPWHFYMGFFSYSLAFDAGLLLIAYAAGSRGAGRKVLWISGLGVLTQSVLHVVAACLSTPVVIALLAAKVPRQRLVRSGLPLCLLAVPPLAISWLVSRAPSMFGNTAAENLKTQWITPRQLLQVGPRYLFPGNLVIAWTLSLALFGVLAGFVVRLLRRRCCRTEAVLGLSAIGCLLLAIALPSMIAGWQLQYVAQRFAAFGVFLGLATAGYFELPRGLWHKVAIGGLCAGIVTSFAGRFALHKKVSDGCKPMTDALWIDQSWTGFQLPILMNTYCGVTSDEHSDIPHLHAMRFSGLLFATAHGGTIPYVFQGTRLLDLLSFRSGPGAPKVPIPEPNKYWSAIETSRWHTDPQFQQQILSELAAYGMSYENIILIGPTSRQRKKFVELGYEVTWQSSLITIAKFRGCSPSILLAASELAGHPTIEVGLTPGDMAMFKGTGPGQQEYPQGNALMQVKIPPVLCGQIWVRMLWDMDHSGGLSRGDYICDGAGSSGRISGDSRSEAAIMSCRPVAVQ